jgi:hypothetical protein
LLTQLGKVVEQDNVLPVGLSARAVSSMGFRSLLPTTGQQASAQHVVKMASCGAQFHGVAYEVHVGFAKMTCS